MNIYISDNNLVIVKGHLQSIEDYSRLMEVIERQVSAGASKIEIHFTEASKLASSIVGYLVKLRTVNDIHISVKVADRRLFELLTSMGLTDIINASFIE